MHRPAGRFPSPSTSGRSSSAVAGTAMARRRNCQTSICAHATRPSRGGPEARRSYRDALMRVACIGCWPGWTTRACRWAATRSATPKLPRCAPGSTTGRTGTPVVRRVPRRRWRRSRTRSCRRARGTTGRSSCHATPRCPPQVPSSILSTGFSMSRVARPVLWPGRRPTRSRGCGALLST